MKHCPHVNPDGWLHWCDPCATIAAGVKPDARFAPGDYVLVRGHALGEVSAVSIELVGQATDSPRWSERVTVNDGAIEGGAEHMTKLVPDGVLHKSDPLEVK